MQQTTSGEIHKTIVSDKSLITNFLEKESANIQLKIKEAVN